MQLLMCTHFCAVYCSMLQGLVDFDGYYLESDPCLVCNNPEVPYTVSIVAYFVFMDLHID